MFHRVVFRTVAWASRRRTLVCAGFIALLAVSAAGAWRLTFDPDVLSLLPHDGRVIPAFRNYLSRVGSLEELYIVFTAPEGYSIEDYREDVDAWVAALHEAPEIGRVDSGQPDRSRNYQWLADRRLLLVGEDRLDAALHRLEPDGITSAVAESRELLAVPSADVADLVRYDPVGLFSLVRDALGADAVRNFSAAGAGYIAEDHRSRLVIARPTQPPFDAAFSRALDTRLQAIRTTIADTSSVDVDPDAEARPPLQVQFAGGHQVAVETEAIVRYESIFNTVGSLALILPLLFVVYRSLWLVGVGALPSALSLAIVLGVLGALGARLSSAATGAAAMLFGLGVDGVVLLYVAHLLHPTSADSPERPSALSGPAASMLLGMWTTAATFYGLMFVDFPSLQQLGRLIGHSMVICGLLTLLLVPALLPRRPPKTGTRGLRMPRLAAWTQRHRRPLLAGAAVVTIVLGAASLRLQVDPTLDRLKSATRAARLGDEIVKRFGLPGDVTIVLAEGDQLEPLLETNERLATRMRTDMPGVAFQMPTRFVPSAQTQMRTGDRIRRADLSPDVVRVSLDRAGVSAGFKRGTFDPFAARLPHLLDPDARLSYEGYVSNGLGDLIDRFIVRRGNQWTLVSYLFPSSAADVRRLERLVAEVDPSQAVTGLTLVNRELSERFLPQFIKGIAIGSLMVVALVVAAFRSWRLSLLALVPTLVGLVWTAGILALAGARLDLFAIFAVVTFLGIGVDYGIHLVHRYQQHGDGERATAELAPVIFVAGAITLLGYGTLINSSYPPLRSMGLVSAVSVVALAAASVLVLPALLERGKRA